MLQCCVGKTYTLIPIHYDTLRRPHHSFLIRCIGWQNNNRTDNPVSYLYTLMKTGCERIEAIMRRRRILFLELVARMEDTRSQAASRARKRGDGVSPGRPQSFRYQRRPVDDCCCSTSGRGEMAQDGGTGGGTFYGGMDRCRNSY